MVINDRHPAHRVIEVATALSVRVREHLTIDSRFEVSMSRGSGWIHLVMRRMNVDFLMQEVMNDLKLDIDVSCDDMCEAWDEAMQMAKRSAFSLGEDK